MRARLYYFLATVLLLGIEVLIALFIHDGFVRPYLGDVLVVIAVYTAARVLLPRGVRLLPLYVFLFAAAVETLQGVHIVERLGLGEITFFRILIGSVFDVRDILCYAAGCLLLGAWELRIYRRR